MIRHLLVSMCFLMLGGGTALPQSTLNGPGLPQAKPAPPPRPRPAAMVGPSTATATVIRDCSNCPEMVLIPAGSFTMGVPEAESLREDTTSGDQDAQLLHTVRIGAPFYLGKGHVTRGQYATFARATGRKFESPPFKQTDDHPAVNISWNDTQAYIAWLSQRAGKSYRLPTEAEWEYAARGGTTTTRWWGDKIGQNHANCDGCGSAWDSRSTAPVGSFAPNRFGLSDMLGNAWQWVQDCYVGSYDSAPADGSEQKTDDCTARVLRGGSWGSYPWNLRAGLRNALDPDDRDNNGGFRVSRAFTP